MGWRDGLEGGIAELDRGDELELVHCKIKPCRNAPNSDVDNGNGGANQTAWVGGAEPRDVGVGIFRPVWFAPPLSTLEFRADFFYTVSLRVSANMYIYVTHTVKGVQTFHFNIDFKLT
jgi:hypothetical protein